MKSIQVLSRVVFMCVFMVASGCSNSSIDHSLKNSMDAGVNHEALSKMAEESKDALKSVLRSTRLNLLNKHRKELLSFEGLESAKNALREKLKEERKLVHIRHAQLLTDFEIKSAKRLGEILLSSL